MQTTQKLDGYLTEYTDETITEVTSTVELTQVVEMAQGLQDMLTEDYPIEDWMQAKVTKAANYIKAVHEHITNDLSEDRQADNTDHVKVYVATN
jgi:bacterioferritin (cytochrome b1)